MGALILIEPDEASGVPPIAIPVVAGSGTLVVHRNWLLYYNGGH
jgi:hypothetical protein